MKYLIVISSILLICLCLFGPGYSLNLTSNDIQLGAYYYDGWNYKSTQVTPMLKKTFSQREPKWGWMTSKQEVIDQQILEASNAGISFFSFCWYYNKKDQKQPLNNALELYHNSKYNSKLKFCLMVANHEGFFITKDNWDIVTDLWIKEFKSKYYLTVGRKPLIIFFSVENLIYKFGSADAVNQAFRDFRLKATKNGLDGISIAACVSAKGTTLKLAEQCGYDLITGYNHHSLGFNANSQQVPIDSMQSSEVRMWDNLSRWSKLKYIPVSTLNWDPRPWANTRNKYDSLPFYVGYSQSSVYKSVNQLVNWVKRNPDETTAEKIALLYAWNEYGEGAYLTPTKDGENFLDGLKRALK